MALNVFTPPVSPSSIEFTDTLKTRSSEFGDQYEQNIVDGINPVVTTVNLSWQGLSLANYLAIRNFVITQNTQPFLYTIPGTSIVYRYRCVEDMKATPVFLWDQQAWNLSIQLKRVYI